MWVIKLYATTKKNSMNKAILSQTLTLEVPFRRRNREMKEKTFLGFDTWIIFPKFQRWYNHEFSSYAWCEQTNIQKNMVNIKHQYHKFVSSLLLPLQGQIWMLPYSTLWVTGFVFETFRFERWTKKNTSVRRSYCCIRCIVVYEFHIFKMVSPTFRCVT